MSSGKLTRKKRQKAHPPPPFPSYTPNCTSGLSLSTAHFYYLKPSLLLSIAELTARYLAKSSVCRYLFLPLTMVARFLHNRRRKQSGLYGIITEEWLSFISACLVLPINTSLSTAATTVQYTQSHPLVSSSPAVATSRHWSVAIQIRFSNYFKGAQKRHIHNQIRTIIVLIFMLIQLILITRFVFQNIKPSL